VAHTHTPEQFGPLDSKLKRIYAPRLISDHIMMQEDFERLHKFLLEIEMRKLVEEEWPELAHKLPPRVPQSVELPLPGKGRSDHCSPNCCQPKADQYRPGKEAKRKQQSVFLDICKREQ
jgi:hypothetical protein